VTRIKPPRSITFDEKDTSPLDNASVFAGKVKSKSAEKNDNANPTNVLLNGVISSKSYSCALDRAKRDKKNRSPDLCQMATQPSKNLLKS